VLLMFAVAVAAAATAAAAVLLLLCCCCCCTARTASATVLCTPLLSYPLPVLQQQLTGRSSNSSGARPSV
jgi:hypothetical protein